MIGQPKFNPCFRWEIVPSEGVFLMSEKQHVLLRGESYIQLAPLLNGQHTIDEIILLLQNQLSALEVFYLLDDLRRQGYVVDSEPSIQSEQAAFWGMLDIAPKNALKYLQNVTISVVAFGDIDSTPFTLLLQSLGISVEEKGDRTVVLTDDYLQEGLHTFNQNAQRHGYSWMLVKPVGIEIWVGPIFIPNQTGCWECLRHRLQGHRKVERYLQKKKNTTQPFSTSLSVLPSTLQMALGLAATETAKWVVGETNPHLEGNILTLNTLSLKKRHHALVRRPQCSCCGNFKAVSTQQLAPVILQSQKKSFTSDGGHRSCSPDETFQRLAHHISPITGIASALRRNTLGENEAVLNTAQFVKFSTDDPPQPPTPLIPPCEGGTLETRGENSIKVPLSCSKFWGSKATPKIRALFKGDLGGSPSLKTSPIHDRSYPSTIETLPTHSYLTDHNAVLTDDSLYFLRESLRGRSGGKGKQDIQAKASALCESIERYAAVFQGDEARIQAKFVELDNAILPNTCTLFSDRQFAQREQWNANGSRFNWVPEPYDETLEIEWSPVWSLTHHRRCYVPMSHCYYGYSSPSGVQVARADGNGCAAGNNKEEAILQGFMELVERDSAALWWYNRLKKPAVDLSSFDEPYFQELLSYYQIIQRDLWVLDITSDLNIPAFVAISRRTDQDVENIIFGFGAHFDPNIGILRALTELNQLLPVVFHGTPDSNRGYEPEVIAWWQTATIENQPYLTPDQTLSPKVRSHYPQSWSDDLYTDVNRCVQIAAEKGLETLVLDQTRPDIELHVVKVIVPGLRHFWPRFAPGRLYDVPVQMGWLSQSLTEEQLNPYPIFF